MVEGPFSSAVVLGAGAIGSYLAARLSRLLPVTAIARGAHAEALRARELEIEGLADERVKLDCRTELAPLPERALLLVTVKAPSSVEAGRAAAPRLAPDTVTAVVQNGLGGIDAFKRELPAGARVLAGVAGFGCTLARPGRVEFWGGPPEAWIVLAPDPDAERVAALLTEAGVPCAVARDWPKAVWTKVAVNCVANPLSAILGVRNRGVVTGALAPVRRAIVEEVRAVARAEGAELDAGLGERIDAALAGSRNVNSMLQDVRAKRETEIEFLSGEVARRADAHGLAAPVNASLASLVRAIGTIGEDVTA